MRLKYFSIILVLFVGWTGIGASCDSLYCRFTYLGFNGFAHREKNPFVEELRSKTKDEYLKFQVKWFARLYDLERSFFELGREEFEREKIETKEMLSEVIAAFGGTIHPGYIALLEVSILRMMQGVGEVKQKMLRMDVEMLLHSAVIKAMKKGEAKWGVSRNIIRVCVYREMILVASDILSGEYENRCSSENSRKTIDSIPGGVWCLNVEKKGKEWKIRAYQDEKSVGVCSEIPIPEICELGGGAKLNMLCLLCSFSEMRRLAFEEGKVLFEGTSYACRIDHTRKVCCRGHPFVLEDVIKGVFWGATNFYRSGSCGGNAMRD